MLMGTARLVSQLIKYFAACLFTGKLENAAKFGTKMIFYTFLYH